MNIISSILFTIGSWFLIQYLDKSKYFNKPDMFWLIGILTGIFVYLIINIGN